MHREMQFSSHILFLLLALLMVLPWHILMDSLGTMGNSDVAYIVQLRAAINLGALTIILLFSSRLAMILTDVITTTYLMLTCQHVRSRIITTTSGTSWYPQMKHSIKSGG
jgi:hypothetical protein